MLYHARVRSAIAPMYGEPRLTSAMVSQQLAGRLVEVISEDGEWLRVRGSDQYAGWVHGGYLARLPTAASMRESEEGLLISLGCTTQGGAGVGGALPLRALVAPGEQVVAGEAITTIASSTRFPLNGPAIADSARTFFRGTSYLWGGVTPWGADCSGLVQTVYALHGMQLPRDAWQQATLGTAMPSEPAGTRPGDLLFFSDRPDRRVTHVGVALDSNEMVHLSLTRGGYACEVLDDKRDPYIATLRERLVAIRRLIV